LYRQLLAEYGPQGWWPVPSRGGTGRRRGFDALGYHPADYRTPRAPAARFEVIMGAVLTQNTAWTNAAAALVRLREAGIRLPADLLALSQDELAGLIRSSGYFNQKAKKLASIAAFFSGPGALSPAGAPARAALLSEWGIGPETADSILLYAFHVPVFVVDAYTRRILARVGLIGGRETYGDIQDLFHSSIKRSAPRHNELHALIVQHAKAHCTTRPECGTCPVRRCRHRDHGRGPVRAPRRS